MAEKERSISHIAQRVAADGYAMLKRYRPATPLQELANAFGHFQLVRSDKTVQSLTPKHQDSASPTSYSGIYGLSEFPFHTDLAHTKAPPHYVVLRCIVGFAEVPTLLIDGQEIIRAIGPSLLARALVKPRRPQGGRMFLMQIVEEADAVQTVRWDDVFLVPASKAGELGMLKMREAIDSAGKISIHLKHPGDTLLIDNWRMLHARGKIMLGCETRLVERAYLKELH